MKADFVGQAFGLTRVTLNQNFVPSSEGQVRAVLAGWGVGVVRRLLAEGLLQQGLLLDVRRNGRRKCNFIGTAGNVNPRCWMR